LVGLKDFKSALVINLMRFWADISISLFGLYLNYILRLILLSKLVLNFAQSIGSFVRVCLVVVKGVPPAASMIREW